MPLIPEETSALAICWAASAGTVNKAREMFRFAMISRNLSTEKQSTTEDEAPIFFGSISKEATILSLGLLFNR